MEESSDVEILNHKLIKETRMSNLETLPSQILVNADQYEDVIVSNKSEKD